MNYEFIEQFFKNLIIFIGKEVKSLINISINEYLRVLYNVIRL